MESPHIIILKSASQGSAIPATELRDALFRLDHMLADLVEDLQIPFRGPCVGLRQAPEQHLLAVARHRWSQEDCRWGVAICSQHPRYDLRAEWTLATVSRERLPLVVKALPAFFSGYASAAAQGIEPTRPSLSRLKSLAELFAH
ncbi:hypothetical protein B1757_08525 [Acidithiobacillus marinus]|uniref:Uncharacterized protein n=1 Tax=Acidithiobacillus marinus TaxID=187490 RepID=A0A2I1DL77_9PROT|nr:hypothetical protein [Acidithiobacillus marinus]PKY10614.1 hypothetical protein B1757_08525 [Acidithiobacillus marinus]